jgi:hypothetical protein
MTPPTIPPTKANDCLGYGQKLPPEWRCPPACSLARECYEALCEPEQCLLCNAPASIDGFCETCYEAVNAPEPTCRECGKSLEAWDIETGGTVCVDCWLSDAAEGAPDDRANCWFKPGGANPVHPAALCLME